MKAKFLLIFSVVFSGMLMAQYPLGNNWIDVDGTHTIYNDGSLTGSVATQRYVQINLGFTFTIFGKSYTSCYVNDCGNISFRDGGYGWITNTFPAAGQPNMLAVFWTGSDISWNGSSGDGNNKRRIAVKTVNSGNSHHAIITWEEVGIFSGEQAGHNTFQVILTDGNDPLVPGGNTRYSYKDMQVALPYYADDAATPFFSNTNWATVGAQSDYGDAASANFVLGRFGKSDDSFDGRDGLVDGIEYLEGKYWEFDVRDVNMPPYVTDFPTDTVDLCPGDTFNLVTYGQEHNLGQTLSSTITNSTFPANRRIFSTTTGVSSRQEIILYPTEAESGIHEFVYTTTDNSFPQKSDVRSLYVNVSTLSAPTISGDSEICNGETVILTAQAGFSSYLWSTGATTRSIQITQPGTYTVTVSNGHCSSTGTKVVGAQEWADGFYTRTGKDKLCPDSTITFTVNNALFSSVKWFDNSTGSSVQVSSPTIVSVELTDTAGCSATLNLDTISEYLVVEPTITSANGFTACDGDTVELDAGVYNAYSWSTGASSNTAEVYDDAKVAVEVQDQYGCRLRSDSVDVVFNDIPNPQLSLTNDTALCAGSSLKLHLTQSYDEVIWSNNVIADTLIATQTGSYSATVKDGNNCSAQTEVINVEFRAAPQPTITPSVTNENLCEGQDVELDAGAGYSSYLWSVGSQTTQKITVSQSGTYNVVVEDNIGCVGVAYHTVQHNPIPTASINILGDTTFCFGDSVVIEAQAGLNYQWLPSGGTGQQATIKTSGNYQVIVSSAAGCNDTSRLVSVNVHPELDITITGNTAYCRDEGALLGVAEDYESYLWSDGRNVKSGNFTTDNNPLTVTVTDDKGCKATSEVLTLERTVNISPVISGDDSYCGTDSVLLSVNGSFDSFLWNTGETSSTIYASADDTPISVYVEDSQGCNGTSEDFTVTAHPNPDVQIYGDTTYCLGNTLRLSVDPFTTITWSNGANTPETTGWTEASGDIYVSVIDSNGCAGKSDTIRAKQVSSLEPGIFGSLTYCIGDSARIFAGEGYSTYQWSTGETTREIYIDKNDGAVTVFVEDSEGCQGTSQAVSAVEAQLPTVSISGELEYCEDEEAMLSASSDFVSYNWSNGGTKMTEGVTAADNPVTLEVTDTNGCVNTSAPVSVSENASPLVIVSGEFEYCAGDSAELQVTGSFDNYLWSDSTTSATNFVKEGAVFARVQDDKGCWGSSDTVIVQENPLPKPIITGDAFYCVGGEASVMTTEEFVSYEWSHVGDDTDSVAADANDTPLTVTVTDEKGCKGTSSEWIIEEKPLPSVKLMAEEMFCEGDSVEIRVTEKDVEVQSSAVFSYYAWNTGDTTNIGVYYVDNGGSYYVTVRDQFGCENNSDTIDIEMNELPTPSIVGDLSYCEGENTQLSVSGYDKVVWNIGALNETVTITEGSYWAIVTDSLGCEGTTDTVDVVENGLPEVNISGDTAYCKGGQATISADEGFASYLWDDESASETESLTVSNPGLYSVKVKDNNGCENTSDFWRIVEKDIVNITLNSFGKLAYCEGEEIDVTISVEDGHNAYTWSNGVTDTAISVDKAGTYWVKVSTSNGCVTNSDSLEVKMSDIDKPGVLVLGQTEFCQGEETELYFEGSYDQVEWSNGVDSLDRLTLGVAGTYWFTAKDDIGCEKNSDTVSIVVNPLPVAAFDYSQRDNQLYIDFENSSLYSSQWEWEFGDVFGSKSSEESPSLQYTSEGKYLVTLIAKNSCGADTLADSVIVNPVVGLNSIPGVSMAIYPNPTAEDAVLDIKGIGDDISMIISSLDGKILSSRMVSGDERIDLKVGEYARGTYLIKLEDEKGRIMLRKLIVE